MEPITNIKIDTLKSDGKPVYVIENAQVTIVSDARKGISPKTGLPWESVSFNVKLNMGEGVRYNYLRVTALRESVLSLVKNLQPGDLVTMAVEFNIRTQPSKTTGTSYQSNDIHLLEIKNLSK